MYVFNTCIQGGQQELILLKLMLQVGERKPRVTDALQQGGKGREEMIDETEEKKKNRAGPGIEPGTSRTLSENHASRPTGRTDGISANNHF